MFKQIFTYFFLFCFGIFILSKHNIDCLSYSKSISKNCCTKAETTQKNCCNKKSNENTPQNCDGKCNQASCNCNIESYSFIVPIFQKINTVIYFSFEKYNFYSADSFISEGFGSIWTLPKIS